MRSPTPVELRPGLWVDSAHEILVNELSRARALGFDGAALAEFRDELLRRLTAEG